MYTLRTLRTDEDSSHEFLGTNYRLLLRGKTLATEENFITNFKFYSKTQNIDLICPFIVGMIYHDGQEIPIESNTDYYIMGPNGKTLQHILINQTQEECGEVKTRISKMTNLDTDEKSHLITA
jgi:hypothetical protein